MILILSDVYIFQGLLEKHEYLVFSHLLLYYKFYETRRWGDLPDDPRRNLFHSVRWKFITRLSTTLTALGYNQTMGLP